MKLTINRLKSYISKNYKKEIKILLISAIFSVLIPRLLSLASVIKNCGLLHCGVINSAIFVGYILVVLPGFLFTTLIASIFSMIFFHLGVIHLLNGKWFSWTIAPFNFIFYYFMIKRLSKYRIHKKSRKKRK